MQRLIAFIAGFLWIAVPTIQTGINEGRCDTTVRARTQAERVYSANSVRVVSVERVGGFWAHYRVRVVVDSKIETLIFRWTHPDFERFNIVRAGDEICFAIGVRSAPLDETKGAEFYATSYLRLWTIQPPQE